MKELFGQLYAGIELGLYPEFEALFVALVFVVCLLWFSFKLKGTKCVRGGLVEHVSISIILASFSVTFISLLSFGVLSIFAPTYLAVIVKVSGQASLWSSKTYRSCIESIENDQFALEGNVVDASALVQKSKEVEKVIEAEAACKNDRRNSERVIKNFKQKAMNSKGKELSEVIRDMAARFANK